LIAQGDAKNASDPPVPDYNCREVVLVEAPIFKIPKGSPPRLRAVKKFLDAAAFGSWSQAALSATEGKILGAKLAKDSQGEGIQRQALDQIKQSMRKSQVALKSNYPHARRVLISMVRPYESTLQRGVALIKRNGLSNRARADLLEKRIPAPVIDLGIAIAKSGRLDDPVSFLVSSFDRASKASAVVLEGALLARHQPKIRKHKPLRRRR